MDPKKLAALDSRLAALVKGIVAKRPRTVVEHIVEHGHITTQELKDLYGYNHPPRAARDVRECGVPLETFKMTGTDGRRIAAYRFGDPRQIERHKSAGRRTFSKELRQRLYARSGGRCDVCHEAFEDRYLQIDHRVPYEVAGDAANGDEEDSEFMLLCGTCNRRKSWSCEQCANWRGKKDARMCRACYWGDPLKHTHVATAEVRRVDVVFSGAEVALYDAVAAVAKGDAVSTGDAVKKLLRNALFKR